MSNIVSSRLPFPALAFLLLFVACQTDTPKSKSSPPPLVAVGPDGMLLFADSSTHAIPHYGDTAYLVIYAVRHCEKKKDGTDNPDLSAEGLARAERLGKILDNARIDRVCTTNTKRTLQTGETVKRYAADPPIETFPVAAQNDWLAELLQAGGGKQYVYVGHTNTVPTLLNTLLGRREYENLPDDEFGRFYVVVTKGIGQTEVLELNY